MTDAVYLVKGLSKEIVNQNMFVEKKRNFFYLNDVIFTAGTFLKAKQSPSGWFPIPEREEKSKNQKNSSEAG